MTDVQEAVQSERQYWKDILAKRDEWIVELIQERNALIALVREGLSEAIPDALIFGMHTNATTWMKAKADLQAWTTKANAAVAVTGDLSPSTVGTERSEVSPNQPLSQPRREP